MEQVKELVNKGIEKVKALNKQQKIIGIVVIVIIIGLISFGIYRINAQNSYNKLLEQEESHEEKLKETITTSMIWRATAKYGKISNLYLTEYKKVGINYYIEGYAIVNGIKKYFDAKFIAPGTKNNGLFDEMEYCNWDD